MKWVLTLVATQSYLDKAFVTIGQARTIGNWNDDIVLIVSDDVVFTTEHRRIIESLTLVIHIVQSRNVDRVLAFWRRHPTHPRYEYTMSRPGIYVKYNVFDVYFKQWNIVFYLDAGAVILGDLGRFKKSCEPKGCLHAHSDAYPTYERKLSGQFAIELLDPLEAVMMRRKYPMECDYFQSTVMIFDSSILQPGIPDTLFAMYERYPVSVTGDQAILNLYFTLRQPIWRQLPLKDDRGFLYDFHERDGYSVNDYVILKCPHFTPLLKTMNINASVSTTLTDLCTIIAKHGSDKGGPAGTDLAGNKLPRHVYTLYYSNLFEQVRNDNLRVFELGIGSTSNFPYNMGKYGKPGASLRAWRDFFPNAMIFGGDIDRDILIKEDRIDTFYVDQANADSIREMWAYTSLTEQFDIIIDDGCHEFDYNVKFFMNSFHKLKKGGVFIIEDICHITPEWTAKVNEWRRQYDASIRFFSLRNENYYDDVLLVIQR
jgi:SAM-dependent methyltransferase